MIRKSHLSAILGHQNWILISIGIVLILGAFVPRLWLLETRFFDRDELEHLHTTWLTFEGHFLYRDFFQNHTPLLYFALAPLFFFFDAAGNIEDAVEVTLTARRLMWLLTASILTLTYCLGRVLRDWRVGIISAVFLANTIMFLEKSLEIRPDNLAVTCWIGSLVFLIRGVQAYPLDGNRIHWFFTWSGVLLGMAIMSTQKVLFTGPGLAVAMLWYLLDTRSHGVFKSRFVNILRYLAGMSLPILLLLVYFSLQGALQEFVYFNWLLNAGWKIKFSPVEYLQRLLVQNGIIIALSTVGVLVAGIGMFNYRQFRRGDFVVTISGVGLFIGLFLIPVPHRQYYMMFLPLVALYAAIAIVDIVDFLARRLEPWHANTGIFLLCNLALWVALATTTMKSLPFISKTPVWFSGNVIAGVLGAVLALIHLLYGYRIAALGILIFAASIYPLKQLHAMFYGRSNEDQIRHVRYVLKNTSVGEAVMDGQEGVGVFRPHAYFFWLLDPNIRAILTSEDKRALLAALQRGEIAPKIINLDHALKDLSPEITKFLVDNYEPVNIGNLRVRKQTSVYLSN